MKKYNWKEQKLKKAAATRKQLEETATEQSSTWEAETVLMVGCSEIRNLGTKKSFGCF